MATIVTRTRLSVSLYLHCLSCSFYTNTTSVLNYSKQHSALQRPTCGTHCQYW